MKYTPRRYISLEFSHSKNYWGCLIYLHFGSESDRCPGWGMTAAEAFADARQELRVRRKKRSHGC